MKAIKPKHEGTVKVNWRISVRTKEIISEYSKYTKYEEDEIADMLLAEILEDEKFVGWLKKKRYKKKIDEIIFNDTLEDYVETSEVMDNE